MGACRVEYLLQSLPPSDLLGAVVKHCETGLYRGLLATLGCSAIPSAVWEEATIPVRLGGLGLRAPSTVQNAARLAALAPACCTRVLNIRDKAL